MGHLTQAVSEMVALVASAPPLSLTHYIKTSKALMATVPAYRRPPLGATRGARPGNVAHLPSPARYSHTAGRLCPYRRHGTDRHHTGDKPAATIQV